MCVYSVDWWTVFCCVHRVLALCWTVFWCVLTLLVLFVGLYFDVCVQCWNCFQTTEYLLASYKYGSFGKVSTGSSFSKVVQLAGTDDCSIGFSEWLVGSGCTCIHFFFKFILMGLVLDMVWIQLNVQMIFWTWFEYSEVCAWFSGLNLDSVKHAWFSGQSLNTLKHVHDFLDIVWIHWSMYMIFWT